MSIMNKMGTIHSYKPIPGKGHNTFEIMQNIFVLLFSHTAALHISQFGWISHGGYLSVIATKCFTIYWNKA